MVMVQYWPVFAFAFALFIGSIGTAIGATMWLAGRLSEQDAKRIELKEALLLEIRESRHTLYGRIEQQYTIVDEKMEENKNTISKDLKDLSMRVTRLEALLENEARNRDRRER